MKQEEISRRYKIPKEIIKEYDQWELCNQRDSQLNDNHYDEDDLITLRTIMTLQEIGFCKLEAKKYIKLLLEMKDTRSERLCLLEKHRIETLDTIHLKEKQLVKIDYLRFEILKKN